MNSITCHSNRWFWTENKWQNIPDKLSHKSTEKSGIIKGLIMEEIFCGNRKSIAATAEKITITFYYPKI